MTELNIPEPIAAFIAAVNRHDEAAFLDFFTPSGAVDDWGRTFTGREQIKAWSDKEFIGSKGVLTPTEITTDGEQVSVIGDWRSNHANGLSRFSFDITGDSINKMTIREG
ncbi:nuclear transport factor 2 family protein [Pseudoclavibacter helvolus]|uniref:nuclear transport factor 2 family protein n=1 Tax=Pseudoclavibacter helvolus TaxID=255205 RepID=UPI003C74761B